MRLFYETCELRQADAEEVGQLPSVVLNDAVDGALTGTVAIIKEVLCHGVVDGHDREIERALGRQRLTEQRALRGVAAAPELLRFVDESESDLVVMGAVLRRLDDRPSLGATVESVLRNCDATVVVVVVPVDL